MQRVFLIPGFFGFANFGDLKYFAHVQEVLTSAFHDCLKLLALDVIDDNEPAIALYRRKGFKPTGESNAFPPPREHIVEIRMAISL